MKSYYRVMLGRGSVFAAECIAGSFIGVDFLTTHNLTGQLPDNWRAFNHKFVPVLLQENPEKTRVAAGLGCGALWTIAKGIQKDDVVLCPDGEGHYHIGVVNGEYSYVADSNLPHRRLVQWLTQTISRSEMSEMLKRSTGSIGTVCNVTAHHDEIEKLIAPSPLPSIIATDETIQDPLSFAMEQHLEDFLVKNWAHTSLGEKFTIYKDDDEKQLGQQFPTDTGQIDILAVSKDKQTLLVVELKKGRASDVVVGQTLRYMGYVKEELADQSQQVKGVIIALEDDQRIRRALSVSPNIEFYGYEVSFKLRKTT